MLQNEEFRGRLEEMELLAKELEMYCPISKMIAAAGTKIEMVWNITRPGD